MARVSEKVLDRRNYERHRYWTDPHFRNDRKMKDIANTALLGTKPDRFVDELDCTVSEFQDHIESQFVRGMNWNNYGTKWEIDHIVPKSAFDLSDEDEYLECAHFSNVRPLFRSMNRPGRNG